MEKSAKEQAVNLIRQKAEALLRERDDNGKKRAELDERDLRIDRELADCAAGARVFGETLVIPPKARNDAGQHTSARDISLLVSRYLSNSISPKIVEPQTGGPKPAISEAVHAKPAMRRVKDIVLDRLKEAGLNGRRAADIHSYITTTYGEKIHEKTVGMTLYRLLKRGLVHRRGVIWFLGPSPTRPKNPGAPAPGQPSSGN